MTAVRVQGSAALRIDEIYRYSRERWGEARADAYVTGLFDAFEKIAGGGVASRPVPAEFGVDGYFFRYEKHFVYWKWLSNSDIGIVTVLHERMHQIDRFREDYGEISGDG